MDNTSPSPQDRAPLIAIGRTRGALLRAVLVGMPLAVCLARNAIRTGRSRVPDRGPPAARKRLMAPAAEGLDRVDVVYGLMIWVPHFEDGQENAHETDVMHVGLTRDGMTRVGSRSG